MDLNKKEVAALEKTVKEADESQVRELQDLQLALVGGGYGTVIVG